MNSITDLLDLEDSDIIISDSVIDGTRKILTLETPPSAHFCPCCGYRMHSKGIKKRKISHPILQDNYELVLILNQRRWRCTNPECHYEANESFKFVNRSRRCTNASDMLIVMAFKDLSASASAIARQFHTSDTHVLEVFDRYVKMPRLKLTDIISVDEVHLEVDANCKYALVIQDFYTGDPIDILRSRRTEVTEPYFSSIPVEERNAVKFLLSDMYNPYLAYVEKYFPHAVPVVDSFHVVQWVIHAIDTYMRQLLKKYRQRDRQREEQKSAETGQQVTLPVSDEVYLLTKYRWLVLSNRANIQYHIDTRMDSHFRHMMNTYDYEDALFRLDPHLEIMRDLKELYVQFNARNAGQPLRAKEELSELISEYFSSGEPIFFDFAKLLNKFQAPILNSFIMVEKYGAGEIYDSRLSNGPIEALNRKVKDLKRLGRGYRNFEHFRTRFLYATRKNPVIDATSAPSVQYYETDD